MFWLARLNFCKHVASDLLWGPIPVTPIQSAETLKSEKVTMYTNTSFKGTDETNSVINFNLLDLIGLFIICDALVIFTTAFIRTL